MKPAFEAWIIFEKVATLGSFIQAARELRLDKSTVSKNIARLESRLGVALFARTPRHLGLTEAGRNALVRVQRILSEGEALEAEVREITGRPYGTIRVAAPMSFGTRHLAPILPRFFELYPDVRVIMDFSDSFVDIVEGGFDVAIRIAALSDSTLRVRRFYKVRRLLLAAPAFLDKVGRPQHPRDLENLPAFIYVNSPTSGLMRMIAPTGEDYVVSKRGFFYANNAEAFMPSLIAGQGYGLFPEFIVRDELAAGELEQILPEWSVPSIGLNVVTPPEQLRPARVRVFLDFLARQFSHVPWAIRNDNV